MSSNPLLPRILKAAFIQYDFSGASAGLPLTRNVIVFPYNPETLTRTLQAAPPTSGVLPAGTAAATEIITFRMVLDAADLLEIQDPQTQQSGLYPILSALELLMRPAGSSSLTLFVWGPNRILPVAILELKVCERLFDPMLNPIHADVDVMLQVLAVTEPATPYSAGFFWNQQLAALRAFAAKVYATSLAPLGISSLP